MSPTQSATASPTRTATATPTPCSPDTLLATMNNPAASLGDYFGISVGVSGNLAVVGAWQEDPGAVSDAGIAYVFNGTTGALVSTLNNPAGTANDRFGDAVAISGNLAVVGCYRDDPGGFTDAGTAYVFDATTGGLVTTLNNPTPLNGDFFGISVAISGNLAVVGAYLDDPGGISGAGTAYVFNATTGSLLWTLNNPAPTAGDQFGVSVAISGNLVVVGADHDDPGAVTDAGSAYVFDASTGNLVATLNKPVPAVNDGFGYSVAISGNLAVVGTWGDDPGGLTDAGSAYVFNATTGALVTTLNNPAPTANDWFGWSVAISGNLAVAGAFGDSPGGTGGAGTAYVFDATNGALTTTLNNPAPATSDFFGYSVAIFGGMAVVGAEADDPSGIVDAGTAYSFTCASLLPTPTPTPNQVRDWTLFE